MALIPIDALDDSRLATYRDLPKRYSWTEAPLVVEGAWLVERLLGSRFTVQSILASARHADKACEMIKRCASTQDIPVYSIDPALLHRVVGFKFHRGMLACSQRMPSAGLETLVAIKHLSGWKKNIVVLCPRITNEVNLGGILRVGAAFGVGGFLLGAQGADPFCRHTLRVSMGAAFDIPIRVSETFDQDLRWLQDHSGYQLVASVLDHEVESSTASGAWLQADNVGLVLGPEDFGLDRELRYKCDHQVTIPMHGGTDSLNVVVAAGILLHELRRV